MEAPKRRFKYGKKDTRIPQERRADRKKLYEIMQQADLQCESVEDVHDLFKEMAAMTLEMGLRANWRRSLGIPSTISETNRP